MKHWFCDRGVCWFYDESESFGVSWDESGKVSHNSQGREVAEVRHLQGPHKWRQSLGTEPEINTVPARFRRTQFRGKALGEVWKASAFSNRMSFCFYQPPCSMVIKWVKGSCFLGRLSLFNLLKSHNIDISLFIFEILEKSIDFRNFLNFFEHF